MHQFQPTVTRGWVGGRRGRGGGVGREEAKAPQVKTRGPELPTDGPDHTTRPKGHHSVEFQVDNAQLVHSTGVKVSVMALQGRKSSPQKSRPLESGHRRHAVWIAIEYSYKLDQKNEIKFWCELGWFLQRQSHFLPLLTSESTIRHLICVAKILND